MTREPAPRAAPAHPTPCTIRPRPAAGALQRLLVPGGVLGAAGAAFGTVGVLDPNEPGHYPVCPLRYATGVWCPGCGGLRSAHALVHGELSAALAANALVVVGCAVFAVLWTVWALRSIRGRPSVLRLGPASLGAVGAFVAAFTIVRNLPFGGWLHP